MISIAAARPPPSLRTRRCEMIALRFNDRSINSCSRFSSGKKLMTRSSAWFAELACSVASTRCPVSEKLTAYSIPSRVRISPIRITSGRSEEHTSELQSLMRISYAVFCLKKTNKRMQQEKLHETKVGIASDNDMKQDLQTTRTNNTSKK